MSIFAVALLSAAIVQSSPIEGTWRAWLDSPGGELPFGLEIEAKGQELRAFLLNGSERIDIPVTSFDAGQLQLEMPHYDSRIEAQLNGDMLTGTWRKRRKIDDWTEMSFNAQRGKLPRFHEVDAMPSAEIDGRWKVYFESSEEPAVGIFKTNSEHQLEGTFLTSTGDYRFLAGDFVGGELRLSCFDGAHAFLFNARLNDNGTLSGGFWSRDTWYETWTAHPDDQAALPDAFEQTSWDHEVALADVIFPDLDGEPRSLSDPQFAGKARIIQVFGSWCPNCNDEGRYLSELVETYGERGLSILGLAFELTGDHERDAGQVRRYLKRNDVNYPVLIAGTADKTGATRAFPALDFVRSYPTTIFLRQDGSVRALHSGFTGPATGDAYLQLREEFETLIEELLAEPAEDLSAKKNFLLPREFQETDGSDFPKTITFSKAEDGLMAHVKNESQSKRSSNLNINIAVRLGSVHLSGSSLLFADEILRADYKLSILYDPRRFERRFMPPKLIEEYGKISDEVWLSKTTDTRVSVRSEAIYQTARRIKSRGELATTMTETWLKDPGLRVELAAIWSIGVLRDEALRHHLMDRLSDTNASVRRESIIALSRLQPMPQESNIDVSRLQAYAEFSSRLSELETDPDVYVRQAVAEAQAQ